MNSSFDWTLIRSFLAALEHGSLLGAARALKSSQPTLGRHIAELESQLKTTLFERTGRGLLPTAMALRLADSARAMEAGAMQLERQALGGQSKIAGAVRISASQPVACVLLPPLLTQMRVALPDVTVELVVSNAVSNLLKREADIALRMVQPEQGSVIARKQPADLLHHDLISGDQDKSLERGAAALGLVLPAERIVLRTDDLIAYRAAVRSGLGIGFVADYAAEFKRAVDVQYGASQTLLSTLEISGTGDLFLPADDSYIELARSKGLMSHCIPLAQMQAVVTVRRGNPKSIRTFADLLRDDVRLVQASHEAAAIGKLTRDQLLKTGRWDELAQRTTAFRTSVTDVANDVKLGAADAGIVYDAVLHTYPDLEAVEIAELTAAVSNVVMGVIANSRQPEAALHFAKYLADDERGGKRYAEFGFGPVGTRAGPANGVTDQVIDGDEQRGVE